MTIEKGKPWGEPGGLPEDGIVVRTDAEISAEAAAARRERRPIRSMGLLGGDLARTCGATGDESRLRGPEGQRFPVDLGEVLVDGGLQFFAAHLVARRSWWRGRIVLVANAQWMGSWNVAPRSHPNDGQLDHFEADLSISDRLKARSRLRNGTHLPHPDIAQRRTTGLQVDLDPGTRVWLDGVCVGQARVLSVRVVPDALTVVV